MRLRLCLILFHGVPIKGKDSGWFSVGFSVCLSCAWWRNRTLGLSLSLVVSTCLRVNEQFQLQQAKGGAADLYFCSNLDLPSSVINELRD